MLRHARLLCQMLVFVSFGMLLPASHPTPAVAVVPNSLASLPRTCRSALTSTPIVSEASCMFGYVFIDGKPAANAEVEVNNRRTGAKLIATTEPGPDSDAPYYGINLTAPPLSAVPGDYLDINVWASSHYTYVEHRVLNGAQQVDAVMKKESDLDYTFERQIWEQMQPGEFGFFKSDVAVDGAGLVYVADYGNARIQVFKSDGSFVRQWSTLGNSPGKMVNPSGVVVDRFGYVYVADRGSHFIHTFTSTGTWVRSWGDFNGGVNQLGFPTDLAIDSDGYIYFVEKGVGAPPRIQKRTREGVIINVWGVAGSNPGEINGPEGIAVGPDSLLYVADTDNNRIQVFTREGGFVRQWNGSESGGQPLLRPERVTVAPDGRVLVSDTGNDRIAIFSATGTFLQQWTTSINAPAGLALDASGALHIINQATNQVQVFSNTGILLRSWGGAGYPDYRVMEPIGLTRDNAGNLYVVDSARSVVRKYDSKGAFIANFGVPFDSGPGGLWTPYGITTNGTSELYIVDKGHDRIQVFSLSGVPLRRWGSMGTDPGQLYDPYGIAIDTSGNLYVTEVTNNRVQKFSSQGDLLWTRGGTAAGSALGEFRTPVGVALSPDGSVVYVTEADNDRVQILRASDGQPLSTFGSTGGQPGQFNGLAGIVVAPNGNLLVADLNNYRVQWLAPDGTPIASYGTPGASPGFFNQPTTVLLQPDGRIVVGERYLGRVQVLRPLTSSRPVATIVAATPLVAQAGQQVLLHGQGADSDSTDTICEYLWTLDGAPVSTTAITSLSTAGLKPGNHTVGLQVCDNEGELSELRTVTLNIVSGQVPDPGGEKDKWMFLLYLAGDNPGTTPYLDDKSQLGAIYRLLEATPNQHVTIGILFDGDKSGGGDTTRYLLQPGVEPVIEQLPEANMGAAQTLADFITWGQAQVPADAYYLAIANHGNALDGTSWDYTSAPDSSERLTPTKLQQALSEATDGGARPFDVIHLDSCLMGLVETTYQLQGLAHYLVTSQNLTWSAFAYDQYLDLVDDATTAKQLATGIVDTYTKLVSEQKLPFTIAAIDLGSATTVATTFNTLSGELLRYAQASPTNRDLLASIRQNAQILDSSGDGKLAANDEYIDVQNWLSDVAQLVPDGAVQQAATAAQTALGSSIIAESHASGNLQGAPVNLDSVSGLGIYYPPYPGARTYQTYRSSLSFANATLWDELLQVGLAALPPIPDAGPNPVGPLPFSANDPNQPDPPTPTPETPTKKLFLPIIQR